MTSLEQYQHDRRSGVHDTAEPKDADPSVVAKPTPPPMDVPRPAKPDPVSRDALRAVLVDLKGDIREVREDIKKATSTALVLLVIFLLMAMAATIVALKSQQPPPKPQPAKQAIRIIEKKVVAVKKVQPKPKISDWRKKKCYETGDWHACLAFKKNLPARARVGRVDLLPI